MDVYQTSEKNIVDEALDLEGGIEVTAEEAGARPRGTAKSQVDLQSTAIDLDSDLEGGIEVTAEEAGARPRGTANADKPDEESWASFGLRTGVRGASRAVETLLGAPGDIAQTADVIGRTAAEKMFGKPKISKHIAQLTGIDPAEPMKPARFPTTEFIKEHVTEPIAEKVLPKDYIKPKKGWEESFDEYVGDLTGILHPLFGGPKKIKKGIALAAPALGQVARWGAKQLGFGKGAQETVKVGTMLLTSMGGRPNLEERASQMFEKAAEKVPVGFKLKISPAKKAIDAIEKRISVGDKTPVKDFLIDRFKYLEETVNPITKTINAEEAYQFTRDINQLYKHGLVPSEARGLMHDLSEGMKNVIAGAKKAHPEFVENFQNSTNLWRELHNSSQVSKFVSKSADAISRKFTSPLTAYLLGLPKMIVVPIVSGTVKGGYNMIERLLTKPAIRNQYIKIMSEAAREQIGPTSKSILKFDKMVGHLEK